MKVKALTIFIVLVLALSAFAPRTAHAQAYTTSFTTSITYQNVGSAATTNLQILFYADPADTSPITITQPNLNAGASTSVFVGSLTDVPTDFRGSAVMQSDQPLLATLVQIPQGSTTVFVRPLSNGFSDGAATALVATVLKNHFGSTTIFSIQNIDTEANTINVKFYNTTSTTPVLEDTQTIQAGAAFYYDAGTLAGLGTDFNGSVVATATRADTSAGKIVGSAMELDTAATGYGAKAFETVATGANTLYMPSALCNVFGGQQTSYAIQNTSLTTVAAVTVTFSNGMAATANVNPGAKASFPACNTVPAGFSGSAVITSTGAPVIAMGKAYNAGLSTAFLGAPNGFAELALPYVRWTPDATYFDGSHQRTYIAIQNVGAADIPAGSIVVNYTDPWGHTGTHTYASVLAVGAKFNSTAPDASLTAFGYNTSGAGFGGGVTITCSAPSCQILAIARVTTWVAVRSETAAEDYNGMPMP